jgi:hypothetical protein
MNTDDTIRKAEAELVDRLTAESIRLYARAYDAGIAAERDRAAKICEHMARRYTDMRSAALEAAAENIRYTEVHTK